MSELTHEFAVMADAEDDEGLVKGILWPDLYNF